MSTHTQGRLIVKGTRLRQEGASVDCIATMQVSNQVNWDQDARRLAACWNLCENIPTEDMEGKTLDQYVAHQAFISGMNPNPEGMDLGIKGMAAQMLAASFAGQFIGNGATNYLELRMSHPDVGPFAVTIQRTQGITPTQKLKQVEAQRDKLVEALRRIKDHPASRFDELPEMARTAIASVEGGAA